VGKSEWTVETLRQHTDQRFDDMARLLDERFTSQTKAIDKALDAVERRFEGVNEFRQTLTDQAATFVRQDVAEARFAQVAEASERKRQQIAQLEIRTAETGAAASANTASRVERRATTTLVIAVLTLLILALSVYIATHH